MRFRVFNFIPAFILRFIAGNMQGHTTRYYLCIFFGWCFFVLGVGRLLRGKQIKKK